jgi:exopolyphosphatase/guanosine-5'-triphosphate,3'-diphosphate pyrophosphatase
MAKRTAIIDIGSNSARVVIYEKTSRYGFHLLCEQKSKVRIGEGAYNNNGFLQPIGINRAFEALKSFKETIHRYKANKVIAVATSALRDAPNKQEFIDMIKHQLQISIKVIDGNKEARFGALAATNLLPIDSGISIDIGGGSSDLALIQNGMIIETYSLNLGSVRIKELFFDKYDSIDIARKKAKSYIQDELQNLPDCFKSHLAIGIGGTTRAIGKSILKNTSYPLDKIHAFRYSFKEHKNYLKNISKCSNKELKKFNIKKNRFDTIKEGSLIFYEILKHINAKDVITSGVGVREGVFLNDLLRGDNYRFNPSINPSIISLLDRFVSYNYESNHTRYKLKIASKLYTKLQHKIKDNFRYKLELNYALKLSHIGDIINVYKAHNHAYYITTQELNYKLEHNQIILISMLLKMDGKELIDDELFEHYKTLLPSKDIFKWLSFIYTITLYIYDTSQHKDIKFDFKDNTLYIKSSKSLYMAREKINQLQTPTLFDIVIKDSSVV